MGKIMGKLKHNYNAFPKLQTRFFTSNASFGHFHQVSINLIKISYRYNKSYLPLSFSKYNETNPNLVYS